MKYSLAADRRKHFIQWEHFKLLLEIADNGFQQLYLDGSILPLYQLMLQ